MAGFLGCPQWGYPSNRLVAALEESLRYGAEARCTWTLDQGGSYRWIFHREGDALHITILWLSIPFSDNERHERDAQVKFSTTCDLWSFAAKLQLYQSRLFTSEVDSSLKKRPVHPARLSEEKTLEEFLEEHKRQIREQQQKKSGAAHR
ncbi:MAG TPA: hypothetical protein VF099_00540 [Ktedonobacterales bacterium]